MQRPVLHRFRKAGGEAVDVNLVRIPSLGFQDDLVTVPVREPHDLVFYRRTVPGTTARYAARVHGRLVQGRTDDVVGPGVRERLVTRQLLIGRRQPFLGEMLGELVSGNDLQLTVIYGFTVYPGRRAGLQPADIEAEFPQGIRQLRGRLFTQAAAGRVAPAPMHDAVQEGARCHDHGPACDGPAIGRPDTRHTAAIDIQGGHLAFHHREVPGLADDPLHVVPVGDPVVLGSQGLHGRTLAGIQHLDLHGRRVRGLAHLPAEGVDLPHQLALSQAADGGVAGHLPDFRRIEGYEGGIHPHPGRRQRGFATGVASAYNEDFNRCRPINSSH